MKKTIAALGAGTLLLGLTACGDTVDESAAAVCVDQAGNRVPDSQCGSSDNGMNGFVWYYIMSSLMQPAYGTQVVHNNYYSNTTTNPYAGTRKPANAVVYRGVPQAGFTPSKGQTFQSKQKVNPPAKVQDYKKPPSNGGYNKAPNKPYVPPAPRPAPPPPPRR